VSDGGKTGNSGATAPTEASQSATELGVTAKIVDAMKKAKSVEALDEVYLHAEGILSDSELEAILVDYRNCKEAILKGNEGLFD